MIRFIDKYHEFNNSPSSQFYVDHYIWITFPYDDYKIYDLDTMSFIKTIPSSDKPQKQWSNIVEMKSYIWYNGKKSDFIEENYGIVVRNKTLYYLNSSYKICERSEDGVVKEIVKVDNKSYKLLDKIGNYFILNASRCSINIVSKKKQITFSLLNFGGIIGKNKIHLYGGDENFIFDVETQIKTNIDYNILYPLYNEYVLTAGHHQFININTRQIIQTNVDSATYTGKYFYISSNRKIYRYEIIQSYILAAPDVNFRFIDF